MSTGLAIIVGIAASIACIKLLMSKRGYVALPGIKLQWGK